MANQRYANLLKRAQENKLSANDINELFLVIHDKSTADYKELSKETRKNARGLQDIEEEYPLLPPEADDLSNAVRKKGVHILGGKKSNAYNNIELRRRVYRDIYGEVKRQYGLINENGSQQSYKKLKRKYLKGALGLVDAYEPPIAIDNDITELNDLEDIDD